MEEAPTTRRLNVLGKRLMDLINRIADNLQPREDEPTPPTEGDGENNFAEIPV